jgi:hypothetical protein
MKKLCLGVFLVFSFISISVSQSVDTTIFHQWSGFRTWQSSQHFIQADAAGDVYLAFSFSSSISNLNIMSGGTIPSGVTQGMVLQKYSSNGVLDYTNIYSGNITLHDMKTNGNRIVLSGHFLGTVNFNPSGIAQNRTSVASVNGDMFLLNLNMNGNYNWVYHLERPTFGFSSGIALDASNNVYWVASLIDVVGSEFDFNPGAGVNIVPSLLPSGNEPKKFILSLNGSMGFRWLRKITTGSHYDDDLICVGASLFYVFHISTDAELNFGGSGGFVVSVNNNEFGLAKYSTVNGNFQAVSALPIGTSGTTRKSRLSFATTFSGSRLYVMGMTRNLGGTSSNFICGSVPSNSSNSVIGVWVGEFDLNLSTICTRRFGNPTHNVFASNIQRLSGSGLNSELYIDLTVESNPASNIAISNYSQGMMRGTDLVAFTYSNAPAVKIASWRNVLNNAFVMGQSFVYNSGSIIPSGNFDHQFNQAPFTSGSRFLSRYVRCNVIENNNYALDECLGAPIDFGNVSSIYPNWSGPNGFTFDESIIEIPSLTVNDAGTYVNQYHTLPLNGSCSRVTDTYQLDVLEPLQTVEFFVEDYYVLYGEPVALFPQTAFNPLYVYTWNGPNNLVSNSYSLIIDNFFNDDVGFYSLTIADPLTGCIISHFSGLVGFNTSLPVEFVGISYECESYGIYLNWSTLSEFNSERFDLFVSYDGYEWTQVGSVASFGTSSVGTEYAYSLNVSSDRLFYVKLIQFDVNGSSEVLSIFSVFCESNVIQAFPNPSDGLVTLLFDVDTRYIVHDLFGREVIPNVIFVDDFSHVLDFTTFSSGIYYVNFESGEKVKLIIE